MNSEKLKCGLCSELLVNPVPLACGETVCSSHLTILLGTHSFICDICQDSHCTWDLTFEMEKRTKKVMYSQTQIFRQDPSLAIKETKEIFEKMDSVATDPEYFAFKYFEDLKRQVDVKRELLKIEIDEHSDSLIQTIAKAEMEYAGSDKKERKLTSWDGALKHELRAIIKQCKTLAAGEIEELERINKQIWSLKFKSEKLLGEYQNAVSGQGCRFKLADTIGIEKIFGTLRNEKRVAYFIYFMVRFLFHPQV